MSAGTAITPVFLISLPRSGSTLLQKILAVSPHIATTAEPWVMLPCAAMLDKSMLVAEYWQETCHKAMQDMVKELPGGEEEFVAMLGDFGSHLYARLAAGSGATIFLDKTPRYYLIVPFLAQAFPRAKFIFLFRNPVAVVSSIINTWHRSRISSSLRANYVDIFKGPEAMAQGVRYLGSRAMTVNYLQLVADPQAVVADICNFIDIPEFSTQDNSYKNINFSGLRGDPTGIISYASVSDESIDKWKQKENNYFRKWFLRLYIESLDEQVLAGFGVEKTEILVEIAALQPELRGTWQDLFGYACLSISTKLNRIAVGQSWISRVNKGMPFG